MSTEEQWLTAYLGALPAAIRPRPDDHRFLAAAAGAIRSKWQASDAARAVAAHNYANARYPAVIGIRQLEDLAKHPPRSADTPNRGPGRVRDRDPNGCLVCVRIDGGEPCLDPVTEPRIPHEWTRERWALLMEIANARASPDAGEQAMKALIAEQNARGTPA